MPYELIQPPFALKLRDMPKGELTRYYHWFLSILPERSSQLTEVVKQSPGLEGWQPDMTPDSLRPLDLWFSDQVETRKRNSDELKELQNQQAFPIEIPDYELTIRTFSLATDVGMYFGQVLLSNHSSLKWEQATRSKRFADYGQPVLSGFGRVSLNPVRIAVTSAYAAASKNSSRKSLYDTYVYWSQLKVILP